METVLRKYLWTVNLAVIALCAIFLARAASTMVGTRMVAGALTVAKRQADETEIRIWLASPNEVMREILAISRYDKMFKVVGSVAEAV